MKQILDNLDDQDRVRFGSRTSNFSLEVNAETARAILSDSDYWKLVKAQIKDTIDAEDVIIL